MNINILSKFEKNPMKIVDCIAFTSQNYHYFQIQGEIILVQNYQNLLIFNRFRALMDINILSKFEKNRMKTVDCIAFTSQNYHYFQIQGEIILEHTE